ncbi:MAG: helix-turn-helix transcriptional regulator [Chloroflexi bacterium]|nr:helix-turn-helix transcriptional regulator [Chloroflexota bacterium]
MNSGPFDPITSPYRCPVTATMQFIGGKWKIIILWAITNNVNRFGELQRAIPSITKKMLTSELRALERDGFISRKVYPVVPLKVEYSITPLGDTLRPVLGAMGDWGQRYALPMQEGISDL